LEPGTDAVLVELVAARVELHQWVHRIHFLHADGTFWQAQIGRLVGTCKKNGILFISPQTTILIEAFHCNDYTILLYFCCSNYGVKGKICNWFNRLILSLTLR
jgi:hypothetical protein